MTPLGNILLQASLDYPVRHHGLARYSRGEQHGLPRYCGGGQVCTGVQSVMPWLPFYMTVIL